VFLIGLSTPQLADLLRLHFISFVLDAIQPDQYKVHYKLSTNWINE
jgi:hypothetical protein